MPKRKEKFFLSYEKAGSEQSITSRNKVKSESSSNMKGKNGRGCENFKKVEEGEQMTRADGQDKKAADT